MSEGIDRLEQYAHYAGHLAKQRHLQERWKLDDGGIMALAIGLAQIYLHEQIHQGHLYGLPDLALLYVSKFREAYNEEV